MTDYNDGKIHGWNGGPCPVHPKTEVMFWTRESGAICGENNFNFGRPEDYNMDIWEHARWDSDIIAFQVITPYIEPVPPRECWSFCSMNFATEAAALDLRVRVAEDNPGKGYEDMPVTKWREVKE